MSIDISRTHLKNVHPLHIVPRVTLRIPCSNVATLWACCAREVAQVLGIFATQTVLI